MAVLTEDLRIGVIEGDDRYIFGRVGYVLPTRDGSVWVVDAQGPRVRIYDGEGRYVRDVGRPGAGPGEIASVMGIDATPDGRVAIWDLRNARVSIFRADGEYIDSFQAVSGWWGGENFQVDHAARFWVYTSVRNPACIRTVRMPDGSVREVGSEGPGCGRGAYLLFSPGGERTDTVYVPEFPARDRVPSFSAPAATGVFAVPQHENPPVVPGLMDDDWRIFRARARQMFHAGSVRPSIGIFAAVAGAAVFDSERRKQRRCAFVGYRRNAT